MGGVALVVAALTLAVQAPATRPAHDDAVTLLAASGHLDDWEETAAAEPAWVPAGKWTSLVTATPRPAPIEIARGVGQYDLHPPAHGWVVATWRWLVGASFAAALGLNALLAAVTALIAAAAARSWEWSRRRAIAAGIMAGASPAVLATSLELRPYALAAPLVLVLTLVTLRWARDAQMAAAVATVVLGALAILTHYSAVWVVAAAALVAVIVRRGGWRGYAIAVAPYAAAVLLAVVAFPYVLDQFARQGDVQVSAVGPAEALRRAKLVASTLASFVWLEAPTLVVAVVVVALAVLGVVAIRRGDPLRVIASVGGLSTAFIAGYYVIGRVPDFAMAPKYLAFVWPLFALVAAGAISRPLVATLVVLVGVGVSWGALTSRLDRTAPSLIADAAAVIVDTDSRGVAPRVLWALSEDVHVLVGRQDELLVPGSPLTDVPACPLVYVSSLRRGGTDVGVEEILERLAEEGWALTPTAPVAEAGTTWRTEDC